jgi:hypothetical protein
LRSRLAIKACILEILFATRLPRWRGRKSEYPVTHQRSFCPSAGKFLQNSLLVLARRFGGIAHGFLGKLPKYICV